MTRTLAVFSSGTGEHKKEEIALALRNHLDAFAQTDSSQQSFLVEPHFLMK